MYTALSSHEAARSALSGDQANPVITPPCTPSIESISSPLSAFQSYRINVKMTLVIRRSMRLTLMLVPVTVATTRSFGDKEIMLNGRGFVLEDLSVIL